MSCKLKDIVEKGCDEPCPLQVPDTTPHFLDKDLYQDGLDFSLQNQLAIATGHFQNILFYILCNDKLREILVLTRRSETKRKALPRYYDTARLLHAFTRLKPWDDKGRKVMEKITAYHREAATKFGPMTRAERQEGVQKVLAKVPRQEATPHHPLDDVVFENLQILKNTTYKDRKFELFERYSKSEVAFSQMDMAIVQAAFVRSLVLYPKSFGIRDATEGDMEAYLHTWRVLGYYLGIGDSYNICQFGDLKEGLSLLKEFEAEFSVPIFLHMTRESIHMSSAASGTDKFDFHLAFYMNCYAHGIELCHLWTHFSLGQKFQYYLRSLFLKYILQLPIIKPFVSDMVTQIIDKGLESWKRLIDFLA